MTLTEFITFACLVLSPILSSKHLLEQQEVIGFPDSLNYEPIYSSADYPGRYDPSIDYDMEVTGPTGYTAYFVVGERRDLLDGITCAEQTMLNILPRKNANLQIVPIELKDSPVTIKGTFPISQTGLYSFFITSCSIENYLYNSDTPIYATGHVDLRNPFGYLPAHKYPFIAFYSSMTAFFFALFSLWGILCYRNQSNLFSYHHYITLILSITTLEMLMHAMDVIHFNSTGLYFRVIYLLAKILYIGEKLLTRVIMILICTGVGIVHENIKSPVKKALYVLSFPYIFLSLVFELQKGAKIDSDFSVLMMILYICLALVDAIFYVWIFSSLYDTILNIRESETYKLRLYQRFAIVIGLGCFAALLFGSLQINYVKGREWLTVDGWKVFWLYQTGCWEFLYIYFLVTAIAILSPSVEISKYTQVKANDDESEMLEGMEKGEKIGEEEEEESVIGMSDDSTGISEEIAKIQEKEYQLLQKENSDGDGAAKSEGDIDIDIDGEEKEDLRDGLEVKSQSEMEVVSEAMKKKGKEIETDGQKQINNNNNNTSNIDGNIDELKEEKGEENSSSSSSHSERSSESEEANGVENGNVEKTKE